jgi:hypothetical protein
MSSTAYVLSLKSDEELCRIHDRSILDVGWLDTMKSRVPANSAVHRHYSTWFEKEDAFLDALEAEMHKRGLFKH